ncbi:MAG: TonB-dependent receptor [Deltaproteobacteria bacterium]|jgi:iron complex outermembrane receptor protein|nr:TonB-dependent receptor [Deltaproteobacteria bacterium]
MQQNKENWAMIVLGRLAILALISLLLGFWTEENLLAQTEDQAGLPPVLVEGYNTGRAEDGYFKENAESVGPWGPRSLQETPYSMFILSGDFLENAVGPSMNQLNKMMPNSISVHNFYNNNELNTSTRGLGNAMSVDGVRLRNAGFTLESVDSIELISGLTGFLYGGGYVGGLTNYVLKRPTSERYNSITVGNSGGSQYYYQADFGGPIGKEKKFGYRINAFYSNGETPYKGLDVERSSFYAAFDWRILDNLLLQADLGYKEHHQNNHPGHFFTQSFGVNPVFSFPLTPDNDRAYGQKWAYQDTQSDIWGGKLTWEINDIFTLRAAYRQQNYESESLGTFNRFNPINDGTFGVYGSWIAPVKYRALGESIFLDAKFETIGVKHKLTVGYSGSRTKEFAYQNFSDNFGQTPFIYDQNNFHFNIPAGFLVNRNGNWGPLYKRAESVFQSIIVGDEINVTDWLTVMGGVNRVRLKRDAYNAAKVRTATYDDWKATPSVSVIVNPIPQLSLYGTYIEALEEGAIVPDNPAQYVNPGEVFGPRVSEQYEFGAKWTINNRLLLSGAYFWIDRANTINITRGNLIEVKQDGRTEYEGIELSAVGKILDNLTILGGFTYFDATMKKLSTANQNLVGHTPQQTPTQIFKMYLEYDTPFVEGLTLTGGFYRVGKQYTNDNNIWATSPYNIVDLGARFVTDIKGVKTTFRLNVNNVADKSYWQRAFSGQLGEARSVTFSVTTVF